jgi:E1A/CREB-binding protein
MDAKMHSNANATVPTSFQMEAQVAPEKSSNSKLDDHSLLNSFTIEEIELHLASLHRAVQLSQSQLKIRCGEILKGLQSHDNGWVFNSPVDPEALQLHDYRDLIKEPMDLGTVSQRLESGKYHSIEEFAAEVNLTFDNAMTYNQDGTVVHEMAKELKAKFTADLQKLITQLEVEARQNDRACTLCGCEKLLFEPPVFFCNGLNCQSTRIRRNSHFYVGGNGQYFWCNPCYNELDPNIPIELVDTTVMKNDLKKKKNDEVHEESWVQCDECESWIHQICGLFNTRQNKEHHSKYFCPKCLIKKRKEGMREPPRPPCATELPRTKLSDQLERHVHRRVDERQRKLAQDRADIEKIPFEDALKKLECGLITIRQVTSTDRKLEVRDLMKKRYAHKNYPDEFPYRCKCLVIFQRVDGVDVVLFALYIYEHGPDNPPPNQRCVYISYLDSVHFMRPRRLRTFLYHELLICYLDYARLKGFSTAHIWACPPLKGDDYIFYAKPEDQKTPRDGRLRQWYIDMLKECQKRNICGRVTNMYDLYIDNESLDATCMPYLEGDYFPGEAENIIKELLEGGGKKGGSTGKRSKKKANKSKGRGVRVDDDGLCEDDDEVEKAYTEGGRDEVMIKLGETIFPMKESFIVAFLNWSGAKPENMVVPEDVLKYRREAEANGSAELERRQRLQDMQELKDQYGNAIKVIDDDDEDMDCEFFNNRQAFLNLCRGNHYQFDELRRAKHTSMMVLWHLHNRDAPKFVQQCACCNREILTGMRYHCNSCPDYDLCEECNRNPNANRGACIHKLQPIAVEVEKENQDSGSNGISQEARKERQRNLQLHIKLIEHASRCKAASCASNNCPKMKVYLHHAKTCTVKAAGGCKVCKRIWALLRIHAQKCKDSVCPVPQCMAIRERIRQLAKQQQAMDDRRRQEMNRAFRMGMPTSG